ncbi:MAG: ABC transporter ATP-binding protein [Candidatus Dojkabacteria bacterium]
MICVIIGSAITVVGPFIIGDITDEYIPVGDRDGLVKAVLLLFGLYFIAFISTYFQIVIMGRVGQNLLYKLRGSIFSVIQNLPLEFFQQNKSGDIISRINNDTDKLNQTFSENILRFIGNIFIIIGIGVIVLIAEPKLGLIIVGTAALLLLLTYFFTPYIERINKKSLDALGSLSGEIQEDISNFKVIVAFGRRDYFINKFQAKNNENRQAASQAGILNSIITPIYEYSGSLAKLAVLIVGITMLTSGEIGFGTLIAYLLYSERLYQPLRIMAGLFGLLQTGIAAWRRISEILFLESNLPIIPVSEKATKTNNIIEFKNVCFEYEKGNPVLHNISFELKKGKTYALVGPTGGGKSTIASLMARLYDPTTGKVLFDGKDIRSYKQAEKSQKIGFILQEPLLFTGSLAENLMYGNLKFKNENIRKLEQELKKRNLETVIQKFKGGLKTKINASENTLSLGQKQLIAFIRAILRDPELLILDEATANVDTVTEQLLDQIIMELPVKTTKVIIAHRLNTIENADEIFFIAGGKIQKPMNFKDALQMINQTKRGS